MAIELSVEVAVRRPRRTVRQTRAPQLVVLLAQGPISSWTCCFSWQATGAGVSFYFQTLFVHLKVDSNASEVRAQLTVGLAPQSYSNN